MIVTYNNNTFGFPARFPVTVPVPAVALTLCIRSIPNFKYNDTKLDTLIGLMTSAWDTMVAERLVRPALSSKTPHPLLLVFFLRTNVKRSSWQMDAFSAGPLPEDAGLSWLDTSHLL